MSTIKANTLLHSDGTQTTEPSIPALDQRMAKAWVSFTSNTQVINKAYNVSSITDIGTGDLGVNFATAFPDNNITVAGIPWHHGGVSASGVFSIRSYMTTTGVDLYRVNISGTAYETNGSDSLVFFN